MSDALIHNSFESYLHGHGPVTVRARLLSPLEITGEGTPAASIGRSKRGF